jgi:hypothetical protein
MSVIAILLAFILAVGRVSIAVAIAFGVLSHVYYLLFELLLALPARALSSMLEAALLPSGSTSSGALPELELRRYSMRVGVANVLAATASLALGQWLLSRTGHEELRTPLFWTLALNSVGSYLDMWYHKMHRHAWWLLIKLAAYSIVNGRV